LQFSLVGKWQTITAGYTLTKIALIIRNQVLYKTEEVVKDIELAGDVAI
jgi:hypothetical protein